MGRQLHVEVKDRREAVLRLLRREEPAASVARRNGVSEATLYRWQDGFMAGGEAALANGQGRQCADPLDWRITVLDVRSAVLDALPNLLPHSNQRYCCDRFDASQDLLAYGSKCRSLSLINITRVRCVDIHARKCRSDMYRAFRF